MVKYLLLCLMIFVGGCDHFPGPNVRSEFPAQVKLTISYNNGKLFSHEWPPCQVLGLGAVEVGKLGIKPDKNIIINSITIESEGRVVHHFDKSIIDLYIEKEKNEDGHPIWIIDESGIHFSSSSECSIQATK
jgi:hypothetical protein